MTVAPPPPTTADAAPAGDALPVTVSITRHVEPDRVDQMVAWVRAGSSLAERFPGFLGTGWVRPGADSDEWHMLYRFDSAASLAVLGGLLAAHLVAGLRAGPGGGVAARAAHRHRGLFDPPQDDAEDLPVPPTRRRGGSRR